MPDNFNGKALYNPQGRSGEYARWAINFYNGCTGRCEYCYNKRFSLLSKPDVTLKSCFTDEADALRVAEREILSHGAEIIRDGGVFLSFVSDPCTEKTAGLTASVIGLCIRQTPRIPVILLTKRTDWVLQPDSAAGMMFASLGIDGSEAARSVAVGFTLTGHDEMEPGCSNNADRIRAMQALHERGFRTWASIEPVIDFASSLRMIRECAPFCDHFKIGLRTDKRFEGTVDEAASFVNAVRQTVNASGSTVYFKQSLRDLFGGGHIIGLQFVDEKFNFFD